MAGPYSMSSACAEFSSGLALLRELARDDLGGAAEKLLRALGIDGLETAAPHEAIAAEREGRRLGAVRLGRVDAAAWVSSVTPVAIAVAVVRRRVDELL